MLCDRLHTWWLSQARLTTLLPALIARGGSGLRRNGGSALKTFSLGGWGLMICPWSTDRGSTVRHLLLPRFSVGLAVEYSSYFISVLNLDLYIRGFECIAELEVLYAERITCMFMCQGGASVVVYCHCSSTFCWSLNICSFWIALWPSAGQELTSWLSAYPVFRNAVEIVCVPFPFGVWGKMWNSIVSVPDELPYVHFAACDRLMNNGVNLWKAFLKYTKLFARNNLKKCKAISLCLN